MKYIKSLYLIIALIVSFSSYTVSAINTGFETELLDEDKFDVNISVFYSEPERLPINCFDVNNDGLIAIGTNRFEEKRICIYDSKGNFKYGYEFNYEGDFGVEWDEKNLNIYFMRSGILASYDYEGNCKGSLKVKDSMENNKYTNDFIESEEKSIGETKYAISVSGGLLSIFTVGYSKLSVTDGVGTTVLYDVSEKQLTSAILFMVFIVIILAFVWICIAKKIKEIDL